MLLCFFHLDLEGSDVVFPESKVDLNEVCWSNEIVHVPFLHFHVDSFVYLS